MTIGLAITISAFATATYIIMGIGTANAEKKARSRKSISMFTVFMWPIALGVWCFDDSI